MRYKSSLDLDKYLSPFYLFRALKGHPSFFLPIIHFSLLLYSKPVANYINEQGFDLY